MNKWCRCVQCLGFIFFAFLDFRQQGEPVARPGSLSATARPAVGGVLELSPWPGVCLFPQYGHLRLLQQSVHFTGNASHRPLIGCMLKSGFLSGIVCLIRYEKIRVWKILFQIFLFFFYAFIDKDLIFLNKIVFFFNKIFIFYWSHHTLLFFNVAFGRNNSVV